MTMLHLARHGETVWHHENRYAGISDIALTDLGVAQAEALASWASRESVTRIISSDLTRAVATAQPSAIALGSELVIDPRLREVNFGRGEGMTSNEMRTTFPKEYRAFLSAPASQPLPDGELGSHAISRAIPVITEICQEQAAVFLLVGHSTLIRLLLCGLLGIPLDSYRRVFPQLINGAITTISIPGPIHESSTLLASASLLTLNAPVHTGSG